jgi:CubicO group peptidase (beta-lactamase class C family)
MYSFLITVVFGIATFASAANLKDSVDSLVLPQIDVNRNVGAIVGIVQNCTGDNLSSCEVSVNSYGKKELDKDDFIAANDTFPIASITKTFTGVALAHLVNQGVLKLSDKVSSWVPEVAANAWVSNITLLDLATHSSGLPGYPGENNPADPNGLSFAYQENPYKDYTEKNFIDYLTHFDPTQLQIPCEGKWFQGERPYPYYYSNPGFALLGLIIGRATHSDYRTAIKTIITDPLGMNDTLVNGQDAPVKTVPGYNPLLHKVPQAEVIVMQGNGAINSTAMDMLKYLGAALFPESSPIGKAMLLSQTPERPAPTGKIGLGWQIGFTRDKNIIWHIGEYAGFRTQIALDKDKKMGFFYFTNTKSELKCLAETVFGISGCTPVHDKIFNENQIKFFSGTYPLKSGLPISISSERNFLLAKGTQNQIVRLRHLADNKFSILSIDPGFHPKKPEDPFIMEDNGSTTLEFSENAEGKTVLQFTKAAVQCGVTLPPIDEKGIKAEN